MGHQMRLVRRQVLEGGSVISMAREAPHIVAAGAALDQVARKLMAEAMPLVERAAGCHGRDETLSRPQGLTVTIRPNVCATLFLRDALQRFEESDERGSILETQFQSKFVPLNRSRPEVEPFWNVIVPKAARVKPLLQTSC